MILVTVGYQYSADFVRVLLEICYVRNNEVDSEHVILRERKTAVYNYDIVLVLENGDVLSISLRPPSIITLSFEAAFYVLSFLPCRLLYRIY